MFLRVLITVLASLFTGLLTALPAGAQSLPPVAVHVERLSSQDWQISYRLAEDAPAWAFTRSGDNNRVGYLTVDTPGVSLDRIGPLDMLVLDGSVREISLRLTADPAMMGEDYTPVLDLSGDAMALYTHFFQITPITDPDAWHEAGPNPDLDAPQHVFTFADQSGTPVRAQGVIAGPEQGFDFGEAYGGYVLFGDPDPISDIAGGIYAHPDLPERLHTTVLRSLPAALDHLETRLGHGLQTPPMVMLALRTDIEGTLSFRGGAMTGQIAIQMGGDALDDAELYRRFSTWVTKNIHHEVVHLWNGGLVQPASEDATWINEGGAEALSWRSVSAAFGLEEDFRHAEENEALTGCAAYLDTASLAEANDLGQRRANYDCGAVIMLIVDASLQAADPETDLFTFWNAFISAALDRHEGEYDAALFFETYAALGGRDDVADWVRRITREQADSGVGVLTDGLALVGLGVIGGEDWLEIVR